MRIGIIGAGFVGSAIAHAHKHHDVLINDPTHAASKDLNEFKNCDAIFICVPSPATNSGHCNTEILEEVLRKLSHLCDTTIISKVTAPPSVYARLQDQYPNLVHAPEFLTAKNALLEYKYGKMCVVGGDAKWVSKAANVILSGMVDLRSSDVVFTDIKTASLYKYMLNSYLATKVTFMNDLYNLAKVCDVDWNTLTAIALNDSRIGDTHLNVPGPDGQYGWGGGCFPKDISAIIEEAADYGIDLKLLREVETINKIHRKI